MEKLNDLFNLKFEDLIEKSNQTNNEIYNPSPERGKEGVYSAVIRFIPYWKDPKKSIMKKWTVWLVDPLTNRGRYVDCPTTINQKSVLLDMYWKLKNSNSVAEKELAKNFARKQKMASLIQVIKDDNNPDLVGKILIWPFGVKIYNKIQDIMQPEFGEPHMPFDLFEGRAFHVKIKKVGGYNNYDDCKFLEQSAPIMIDGKPVKKTEENMQKIIEFLKENSPDLSKFDFQPWDEETKMFVNTVIKNTVPTQKIIEDVINLKETEKKEEKKEEVKTDKTKSTNEIDNIDLEKNNKKIEKDIDDDFDFDFDDDLYSDL